VRRLAESVIGRVGKRVKSSKFKVKSGIHHRGHREHRGKSRKVERQRQMQDSRLGRRAL
jgi:hypothetical protein